MVAVLLTLAVVAAAAFLAVSPVPASVASVALVALVGLVPDRSQGEDRWEEEDGEEAASVRLRRRLRRRSTVTSEV